MMATSSTAAALDTLPEGVLLRPLRSEIEERRRSEIIWFLRASIDPSEAEAMASPGYRFLPCGGCARMQCDMCNQEASEQVRGGKGGKRSSADPRFVSVILNRTQFTDPQILKRAMPAMAALPPDERWVLLLELGAGWRHEQIAERLKVSRQTVVRLKASGLDRLVREVWG